jgi:hypothetical protein
MSPPGTTPIPARIWTGNHSASVERLNKSHEGAFFRNQNGFPNTVTQSHHHHGSGFPPSFVHGGFYPFGPFYNPFPYSYYSPYYPNNPAIFIPSGEYGPYGPFSGEYAPYSPNYPYPDRPPIWGWPDANDRTNANRPNDNRSDYRVGERDLKPERDAETAIADLQRAWRERNLDLLSKHIRRDAKIDVYQRGKFQYSLDSGDYLQRAREAFDNTKTVRFDLNRPHRQGVNRYDVTGTYAYQDKEGKEHTTRVRFVLEKMDGEYFLIQTDLAPVEETPPAGDGK